MPRNQVGEIVNSLPIEDIVAAPIIAAVKAQKEVSGMLAEYLNTVALDSNGNARMLTFKYHQEGINATSVPTTEKPTTQNLTDSTNGNVSKDTKTEN